MEAPSILLVEDNEGDIFLAREAVAELETEVTLNVVKNGENALRYLRKEKNFKDKVSPDLILLDINLPKLNGLDVLKRLKENDSTKKIPVIMLTTSSSPDDIADSYRNYANCYIIKPNDPKDLSETVQQIQNFWFNRIELPT